MKIWVFQGKIKKPDENEIPSGPWDKKVKNNKR